MPCLISCMISTIFIIGMFYFYNRTNESKIIKHYKYSLSSNLQKIYDKISFERKMISYKGYILGFIISFFIIYYNKYIKHVKINTSSLICIVLSISFLVNYFYYILSPKTDWLLNHLQNSEDIRAWLLMYREMQYNYHIGLVLGIIAVGILAFGFRC